MRATRQAARRAYVLLTREQLALRIVDGKNLAWSDTVVVGGRSAPLRRCPFTETISCIRSSVFFRRFPRTRLSRLQASRPPRLRTPGTLRE